MKKFVMFGMSLLVLASANTFAQGKTRAEVVQELTQLESVGFNPSADDPHYPEALQAAEARLQARTDVANAAHPADPASHNTTVAAAAGVNVR